MWPAMSSPDPFDPTPDGVFYAMGASMVFVIIFYLVIIAISLGVAALMAYLVAKDFDKYSPQAVAASGQSKMLWVVLTFFFGLIPLLIYMLSIRKQLEDADNMLRAGYDPRTKMPMGYYPPMGQPGMGQPPMGQPPMGQPGMGQPPMGQPGMGQPAPGWQPPPAQGQPGWPAGPGQVAPGPQAPGAQNPPPGV